MITVMITLANAVMITEARRGDILATEFGRNRSQSRRYAEIDSRGVERPR
jgi:hypothetical protein